MIAALCILFVACGFWQSRLKIRARRAMVELNARDAGRVPVWNADGTLGGYMTAADAKRLFGSKSK